MKTRREGLIATLWRLSWNGNRLSCVIYQHDEQMEIRVESPSGVIVSEPFEMQPRALARSRALRLSLKKRGWQDE